MRGRCQHISLELPDSAVDGEADERDTAAGDLADHEVDGRTATTDRDTASDTDDRADTDDESTPFTPTGESSEGSDSAADDTDDSAHDDVGELARQYAYLEDVESELSLAQRWVHGRVTDLLDSLSERLGSEADSRFHAEVLAAIARGNRSAREIADDLHADPERVETALDRLAERGLVDHDGREWLIP